MGPQIDHPILMVDIDSTWLSGLEDERVSVGPVIVLHSDADAPRVHNSLYPTSILENTTSPEDDYVLTDPYIDLTVMTMNGHLMLGSTEGLRFLLPANGSDSYLTGDGLERSDEGVEPIMWWSAMSFRGKLSDVEASLLVVTYQPNPNWHGIDNIQFTATNAGEESPIGMGGEVNISISIVPVPDVPVLTIAGEVYDEALIGFTGDGLSMKAMPTVTISGWEDTPVPITVLDIRDVDYDEDPTISIILEARYGEIYLVEPLPLSAFVLEQAYGRVVLKCSNATVAQSALNGLAFVPEPDYSGMEALLTITVTDVTGLQDTRVINIEIDSQNDSPMITLPEGGGLYTVDEGEGIWLNGAECPVSIDSNYEQLFTRQLHGNELWGAFVGDQVEEWPIYIPGVINVTSKNTVEDFFLIKDINAGPSGSSIRNMVLFQGVAYFTAETADTGRELWRSDGSEPGTMVVIDAIPGPEGSNPQFLTVWDSYLYFSASGIDTTWMIGAYVGGDDVMLPSDECGGFRPSILNPDIAFAVAKNTTWDPEKRYDCPPGYYWASTAEGENIFRATYNNPLGSVGPVYSGLCGWKDLEWNGQQRERFRFSDSQQTGAYKHAGKSEAFRPDTDPELDNLVLEAFAGVVCKTNSGTSIYTQGESSASALINDHLKHPVAGLWRTDGTTLGTRRVYDIQHGQGSGSPAHLTIFNNSLWFSTEGMEHGSELYCLHEQNSVEVELIADFTYEQLLSSTIKMLTPAGNVLYILTSEHLWALGADPGSKPKLVSMPEEFHPKFLIKYGEDNSTSGRILISGSLDSTGIELWALDGSEHSVRLVKDICPGVRSSNPRHMTYWNNKVYFQANDCKHGPELWVSDGTTEGTTLVKDIRPGAVGSYPSLLTPYRGELYMMVASDSPSSGPRLWQTNGGDTTSRAPSLVDPDFTSTEIFHPDILGMEEFSNVPLNDGGGQGLGQMIGLDMSNILLVVGSKDQFGFNPPNHGLAASAEYTRVVRQAACVSDADPGDILHLNISCNKCDLSVWEISGYVPHLNHALENLTYTARATLTGWDTVVLTVTDAEGTSTQGEFNVFIQPVNDPPVILGIKEEGGLVDDRIINATRRHSENGGWEAFISGISIEDADAMVGPMTLTLRVMAPGADITLNLLHSLAVLHREEGMLRVAGKLTDINEALSQGISYSFDGNMETEHHNIGDQIEIYISDNGYTGKGGPKADEGLILIRFHPQ